MSLGGGGLLPPPACQTHTHQMLSALPTTTHTNQMFEALILLPCLQFLAFLMFPPSLVSTLCTGRFHPHKRAATHKLTINVHNCNQSANQVSVPCLLWISSVWTLTANNETQWLVVTSRGYLMALTTGFSVMRVASSAGLRYRCLERLHNLH